MKTKDITQIALMTALIIALAFIPAIPIALIPVPIVLQNFGIMLAGLLLGAKKGTISVAILLVLVAVGLPVLTGFRGGLIIFVGPTGGYLLAWLFTPILLSLINHGLSRWLNPAGFINLLISTLLVSVVITYAVAIFWLQMQSHISFIQAFWANGLFIPGDILKAVIAVWLSQRLLKMIHN